MSLRVAVVVGLYSQPLRVLVCVCCHVQLVEQFTRIEQWMTQWTVTEEYTAEVLLLMSKAYAQTNQQYALSLHPPCMCGCGCGCGCGCDCGVSA